MPGEAGRPSWRRVSPTARLRPPGELQSLVEGGVAAHRRRHQEAVAFAENALDIVCVDVRMPDRHVVRLAGIDHARHPFEHLGMLVLARVAELLGEVALAD